MKYIYTILVYFFSLPICVNSQTIYTVAGNGNIGYFGDGGSAILSTLNYPTGIALDSNGRVYFSDSQNSCIRKVNANGTINTVAGIPENQGYSGDGGLASNAKLNNPQSIAFDSNGNLYIADASNHVIRKINVLGIISTIAGTGISGTFGDGGLAVNAQLNNPVSLAIDGNNNIFIGDYSSRIRKINQSTGIITTIAGTGIAGFSGDGGQATLAQIYSPSALFIDANNIVYFTDENSNRVRYISNTGVINTIAGGGSSLGDGGLAINSQLSGPNGIAIDFLGNIYISDTDNKRIRKIDNLGIINTIAGNGVAAYNGSGIPSNIASVSFPQHIVCDNNGNIYFSDTDNQRIRIICNSACLQNISEVEFENSLSLSPNPAVNSFSVNTPFNLSGARYSIYNSFGIEIQYGVIDNNYKIDISHFTDGCYYFVIEKEDSRAILKIVKLSSQY